MGVKVNVEKFSISFTLYAVHVATIYTFILGKLFHVEIGRLRYGRGSRNT